MQIVLFCFTAIIKKSYVLIKINIFCLNNKFERENEIVRTIVHDFIFSIELYWVEISEKSFHLQAKKKNKFLLGHFFLHF